MCRVIVAVIARIDTYNNQYDSPGRVIGPSQRILPDNTQRS